MLDDDGSGNVGGGGVFRSGVIRSCRQRPQKREKVMSRQDTHGMYLSSSEEERNSMSINGQVKKRMRALNKVFFCINPGQKKKNRKFVELFFISIFI